MAEPPTAPDPALDAQAVPGTLAELSAWMRQPDDAASFTLEDAVAWIKARPAHALATLSRHLSEPAAEAALPAAAMVEEVASTLHAEHEARFPENKGGEWARTSEPWKKVWRLIARAALDALHPGLLAGTHVIVPKQATLEMLDVAGTQFLDGLEDYKGVGGSSHRLFQRLYGAMLAAAPGQTGGDDAP